MEKIPTNIKKKLERWRKSNQDVPKEELNSVLDFFFEDWSYAGKGTGSHNFKMSHPKLRGEFPSEYGPGGNITIPVTGGQRVKHWYLKKLLKAIDIIQEGEDK